MRTIAFIVLMVGAVASLGLMLNAGRKNESILLIGLFVIWLLSPFVALMLAYLKSKRWSALARAVLYGLIFLITLISLLAYGGILNPTGRRPAFVFLVVPLASLFVIAIAIPIVASTSRRLSRKKNE